MMDLDAPPATCSALEAQLSALLPALMEMVDADKDKALSVEEMNKQHEKTVAFLMVHEKQGGF